MLKRRKSKDRISPDLLCPVAIILFVVLIGGILFNLSCCTTRGKIQEITQVKVYFLLAINHPTNCICNDPVIREIHKTAKVEESALLALEELVKGPTEEERAKGYGGCIPAGREVGQYKKWYIETLKNYQESGKITDSGKEYLNSEGKFTPWGDRVRVISVQIKDSIAYADFSKELYSYGGGSCRVIAIGTAIGNTLKQFPGVEKVEILIEGRKAELEP